MPASNVHNEITLRPPPGTRFTIWGHDVRIQFERGREREIVTWLRDWIDSYIEPEAQRVEAEKAAKSNVGISQPVVNSPIVNSDGQTIGSVQTYLIPSLAIVCPECAAPPGQPCMSQNNQAAVHNERARLFSSIQESANPVATVNMPVAPTKETRIAQGRAAAKAYIDSFFPKPQEVKTEDNPNPKNTTDTTTTEVKDTETK